MRGRLPPRRPFHPSRRGNMRISHSNMRNSAITFSDSESESNDDIQVVEVKGSKTKSPVLLFSDSSLESSDSQDSEKIPNNVEAEEKCEEKESINLNKKHKIRPYSSFNHNEKPVEKQENESHLLVPNEQEQQENVEENEEEQTIQETENVEQIGQFSFKDDDLHSYTIVRIKKKFSKIVLKLLDDNTEIFLTAEKKVGKKTVQQILKKSDNDPSLPTYLGYVRSHQKSTMFSFCTYQKKSSKDDRECQILGISFDNHNKASVVISKNGKPYFPITQRLSLDQISSTEIPNTIPSSSKENLILLKSTEISSEVEQEFASLFYKDSVKNLVLIDPHTNQLVFALLKSNSELFSLKVRQPFTAVQGFALSIALIRHSF